MENRFPQWSELQADLLELILEKLDLVDHARFASVCSWWRSVAVENPPINKPLYLALSHKPKHLLRRFITSFIPFWRRVRFVGALDGWLVIGVGGQDLFLLNKGFNSIIPLPPPPPSAKNILFASGYFKAALSSPPSSPSSVDECTVVFMHSSFGVFYCRLGSDKSYTMLSNIPPSPEDILFYKDQLYVLCNYNTIVIFDHLLNKVSQSQLVTPSIIYSSVSQSQLVTPSIIYSSPRRLLILENYMPATIYSSPRRLLILGNDMPAIVAGDSRNYSVHMLEGSEPRPILVNNTGDDSRILLSNYFCSLSITAEEHKEFRWPTNFTYGSRSFILGHTSEDPKQANADDPWPLFCVMFNFSAIKNRAIKNPVKYKRR